MAAELTLIIKMNVTDSYSTPAPRAGIVAAIAIVIVCVAFTVAVCCNGAACTRSNPIVTTERIRKREREREGENE